MKKQKVILAGGSGFLGKSLTSALLTRGYDVVILTRNPSPRKDGASEVYWDGKTPEEWTAHLNGATAVINLTGKNVSCRYTPENRRVIIESRTNSVRALGQAITGCAQPPAVWVQTSSLAIYGDPKDQWRDENAPPGTGFPTETCLQWECAFNEQMLPNTRRVILRIGFALGTTGGALGMLSGLTRWFLGGSTGNGRQYISWIHINDLNRMFLDSIERDNLSGVFNATGPNPVTNAGFMRELRHTMGRPWSPPVPAWAAHIGAWMMRTEARLALTGRRCTPARFLANGFDFEFPVLRPALEDLLGNNRKGNTTL